MNKVKILKKELFENGIYVSRYLTNESKIKLENLLSMLNIKYNNEFEPHVTIMASNITPESITLNFNYLQVEIIEAFYIVDGVLCFKLKGDELMNEHANYIKSGIEFTWGEYIPHVTIDINTPVGKYDLDEINSKIKGFKINLSVQVIKENLY